MLYQHDAIYPHMHDTAQNCALFPMNPITIPIAFRLSALSVSQIFTIWTRNGYACFSKFLGVCTNFKMQPNFSSLVETLVCAQ